MSFYKQIEELEFKLLTDAMKLHHSTRKIAKHLEVSEPTVKGMMKKFDINSKRCMCGDCVAERSRVGKITYAMGKKK